MTAGRPTEISDIIDITEYKQNSTGSLCVNRPKSKGVREVDWTADLMANFHNWRDLVDIENGEIELERGISPLGIGSRRKSERALGMCRADALIWHTPKSLTIVEAKVTSSPTEICAGIGQLIFYKTLIENYWSVQVDALVLASKYLPPFILDSIANVQAPIRFLKATDNGFSGLVPNYSSIAVNIQREAV